MFTRGYKQAGFRVTTGMLQVLFAESASAYMGGIRAVVGTSIEEEEAVDSLCAPPVVVTPQPRLASNAATKEVTSRPGPPVSFEPSNDSTKPDGALPTEPDRSYSVDSRMAKEIATGELHELPGEAAQTSDPPPSAPEPKVESDVLDTMVATTDQTTSTTALDLDEGAHEADSTDTGAVADAAEVGQFELGVNTEEPDPSPGMHEPSTGLNDQKIAPVEEVTQESIALTLIAANKSSDPQMERLRTPSASGDEDLTSWCDVCTKCSTRCGYEDVPSSPPAKQVPGIRPDRAPDELNSPGAVPQEVPHARPSRAPDFPPDRGVPDCGSVARVGLASPKNRK